MGDALPSDHGDRLVTRPRLLVVDDDRAITSTLAPLLRDLADVDTAHSVADALATLAAHTYQGCVLDLVLGDDATPLHDALASREVPVLLVSGRDPTSLERVATPRGWSFAAKPVAPQVLRDLVADMLGVEVPEPTQRGVRVQVSTPAPATRGASSSAPVAVQVIDRLGDIVGVIALAALCHGGKLSGELALVGIGAILGVSTGLRSIGGRSVGAATAAVALATLLSTTPAEATDRPPSPPAAPLALLTIALALVGALIATVTT